MGEDVWRAMFARSGTVDPIALTALLVEFTPLGKILPKSWVDGKVLRGLTNEINEIAGRISRSTPAKQLSRLMGEFGGGVVARKLGLRATNFNPRYHGIDGILLDRNGRIVILEAKGGDSPLGVTKSGEQLSQEWIRDRAKRIHKLGDPWGKKILDALAKSPAEVSVLMTRVPRDGDSFGDPLFEMMDFDSIGETAGGWKI